ncbi:MAG: FMN-binding negative transcriptional regulator [Sphingomicrobium sp.]
MHPNRAFNWDDRQAMLEFAGTHAFAHIFTADMDGVFVAHAPIVVTEHGRVQFHVSRRNRAAGQFADSPVLISVAGRDAYHSANWYSSEDQVPTWLYETVEIEGYARQLNEQELIAQVDRLTDVMERRWSPEAPWSRAKMTPGKFEVMVRAIVGFEVEPRDIRGTRKFNQHKPAADVEANIAGQTGAGRQDIAAAIRETATGQ